MTAKKKKRAAQRKARHSAFFGAPSARSAQLRVDAGQHFKSAGGVIVLRIPAKRVALALMGVQSVSLFLLSQASSRPAVFTSCILFGLSVGNLLMLHPLLLAETFGVREYSKIYGLSQLLMTTGVGLGPAVVGFVRDAWSYTTAFRVAGMSSIVAFVLFSLTGDMKSTRSVAMPASPVSDSRVGRV